MTLTPEQLVNLIAAAEAYARAWEAADGTADDARDELTDVVTSVRAVDYGIVRMPTETFANLEGIVSAPSTIVPGESFTVEAGKKYTLPDGTRLEFEDHAAGANMVVIEHNTEQVMHVDVRTAQPVRICDMDTTPADVQDRIDQMQAAGTTAKPCLTHGCNRPRNHLGRCWITRQENGNPSETGL